MLVEVEAGFYDFDVCPHCGKPDKSPYIDGDSIPTRHDMFPDIAFYSRFIVGACPACEKKYYAVTLEVVDNPNVSEGWINKYFWHNEATGEPDEHLTFYYRGASKLVPPRWLVTRQKTPEGLFTSHQLGMFRADEELYGPHGVSFCRMSAILREHLTWLVETIVGIVHYDIDVPDSDEIPF